MTQESLKNVSIKRGHWEFRLRGLKSFFGFPVKETAVFRFWCLGGLQISSFLIRFTVLTEIYCGFAVFNIPLCPPQSAEILDWFPKLAEQSRN